MTVTTPMEGITAPALRATAPPPAPSGTEGDAPLLPSRRQDGWTVPAQRIFLEAIAEGAGVEVACARVGLSTASAYAYRRTAKGAAFALGWRAATLVARDAIAETLLARALEGQVDTIVRGDSVVTRHRHDNRLALALLARLDRQVEAADAGTARDTDTRAARVVAQEFDAFLDGMARDAGPAQAGLFLARRCGTLAAAGLAPAPGANDDDPLAPSAGHPALSRTAELAPIYALAAADRFHRTGHATAGEVAVADLDPAARAGWSAEQWTRADAAGLVAFPAPVENDAPPQHPQHSRAHWLDEWDAPVWWDEEVEAWRTSFPPPPFFIGEETGEPDESDYERALSEEEADAMGPAPGRCDPATLAARAAERDAFFAAQRGEPLVARIGNPPAATRSPADDDHREGSKMSIFGSIKKAIFGDHGPLGGQFSGKKDAAPAPAPTPQPTQAAPRPAPQAPAAPAPAAAPAQTPAQAVDVEQVLTGIAAKKGNPDLNWRTSIVDLMKLLDLDSSLANRKELATELGYTGAKDGSAEMNIWLHKAVMRELEKSGGTVPAGLKD